MGWLLMQPFLAISHPPGVLAPGDPVQGQLPQPAAPIRLKEWTLTPLATYSIHARVLSRRRYSSDSTSEISPLDLLVGWGPMSDSSIIGTMSFRQSQRFGYWQPGCKTSLTPEEIICHSANIHLIPANESVRDRLTSLRVGSLVQLRGKLIEANRSGQSGNPWRSSLTRTDSGNHSCEILYVESIAGR